MLRSTRILWASILLTCLIAAPAWGQQWDTTGTDIYYDDGQVGIGTTSPKTKLDVGGAADSGFGDLAVNETITSTWPSTDYYGYIEGRRADGKRGYYLGGNVSRDEAVLGVPHPSELVIKGAKVGIGTDTPAEKLSVNGRIRSKEVVVEKENWLDVVFDKGYDLPTLEEVSRFIDEEGHLPSVPSTESVKKNGLRLGEMDATLLKKVEELTLYAIEQKERADGLAARAGRQARSIEQLRRENDRLRQRLDVQKRQIEMLMEAIQE